MTLATLKRRRKSLQRSQVAFEAAIRAAVASGCSKTAVAEAAGISRPTLYQILQREDH